MNQAVLKRVAGSAFMRGASEAALSLLRGARLTPRAIATGEHVFRPGDSVDAIYFLLDARMSGRELDVDPLIQVELTPSANMRPLRFDRVVHGDIFGEIELLEQGLAPRGAKRSTLAVAITPGTVVPLPLSLLSAMIEQDGLIRDRLVGLGSKRLITALKQQHDKVRTHPDLLLADWLVELSADIGVAEGNRVRFRRKIPQSDIAADLGVSRETISRRLNEWERSGLLRTGARRQQIEILDYQRISRLASLHSNRSREVLERTVKDIDMAIAGGDLIRARNIGLDIVRHYPSSPELHHRIALAAARGGDVRGALELLSRSGLPIDEDLSTLEDTVRKARKSPFVPMRRLIDDPWIEDGFGEDEPAQGARSASDKGDAQIEAQLFEDLAALHARLLKERAFAATRAADRRKWALASFHAYNALFEHRRGYYPGINAATMALVGGDQSKACRIAENLIASLQPDATDFWQLATLAEALLICGKQTDAKAALARARVSGSANDGAKASTILQFRRLTTVLDYDPEIFVTELSPHNVAVISGHMFLGSEMDEVMQSEAEAAIRQQALELFAKHNIGFVYGALACGADIILAETALEHGAEFNAVLPFSASRFIETSVKPGDPPDAPGKWEKRLRAILDGRNGAHSLTVMDSMNPIDRDLDGYLFYGFRHAAGSALQRATLLQTQCRLISISDGKCADNVAGTNQTITEWRAGGRPFDLIRFPYTRPPRIPRERPPTVFRPAVFLWHATPDAKDDKNSFRRLVKSADKGLVPIERTLRDGRRGLCLVAATTQEALTTAFSVAEQANSAKGAIRIICDFGPVLGRNLKPDKKQIARLQAADDLPGLPSNCVLATETCAAQVKFDLGDDVLLTPVGRAEVCPGDDADRQVIRSRPSLPIYTIRLTKAGSKHGANPLSFFV